MFPKDFMGGLTGKREGQREELQVEEELQVRGKDREKSYR